MRKIYFLALLCCIAISASAQRLEGKFLPFTENLEYKVKWFTPMGTSQGGYNPNNPVYSSGKGKSFQILVLEVKNDSEEHKLIDFTKFAILDDQNQKYYVKYASQSMKMSDTTSDLELKLRAGKTKTFMIEFWPPFPDSQLPRLLVDDQIIDLEWKKKEKDKKKK